MKLITPKRPRPHQFIDIGKTKREGVIIARTKAESLFPSRCYCNLQKNSYMSNEEDIFYALKFDIKDDLFAKNYFHLYLTKDYRNYDFNFFIGLSKNNKAVSLNQLKNDTSISEIEKLLNTPQTKYEVEFKF